jgi:hypothetical protein
MGEKLEVDVRPPAAERRQARRQPFGGDGELAEDRNLGRAVAVARPVGGKAEASVTKTPFARRSNNGRPIQSSNWRM